MAVFDVHILISQYAAHIIVVGCALYARKLGSTQPHSLSKVEDTCHLLTHDDKEHVHK